MGLNFWLFRFSQVSAALGFSASSIAIVWWVLNEYHKLIFVTYIIIPALVITALSQPFVAPAGDRFSKKKLLVSGCIIQSLSYFAAAFILKSNNMNIILMMSIEIISAIGKVVFNAGSIGILPHLVCKDKISDGINIIDRINSTISILGGVFGGFFVTLLGVPNSFFLYSICLMISCFLCVSLKYKNYNTKGNKKWFDEVKSGFLYTIKNPVISGFFFFSLLLGLAFAPMLIAFPYIIKQINGLPAFFIGILSASMGLGTITGSLAYNTALKKISKNIIVYISSFIFFFSIILVCLRKDVFSLFLCQFLIGISRCWINVTVDTMLLLYLPENLRTKVLSNMMFFSMINIPIAMVFSGFLMDYFGIYNFLGILSIIFLIAATILILNTNIRIFLMASPEKAALMLKTNNSK